MNVPIEKRVQEHIYKFLKNHSVKGRFLDVGCGDGYNLEVFSKWELEGDGIDISKRGIEIAKSKNLPGINLINDDFMNFNANPYHLIFLLATLEHLKNDKEFLEKVYRLLEVDGLFILSVPANPKAYGFSDYMAGHYRRYSKSGIMKLLESTGFSLVRFMSVGFPLGNFQRWFYDNINKIIYGTPEFNSRSNDYIGIEKQYAHFSPIFRLVVPLAFFVFKFLVKLDLFFVNTNLAEAYLIFSTKK